MTLGRERYFNRQKITFASACLALALLGDWIAHMNKFCQGERTLELV